ncbi:MAG: branched-chain amino acid aminotransferase [Clostridia bacterium]|nr:branched-chain amino acid aminotransferase [Clostridia bacterium]MBQ6172035.1 branched-chain amino acid aminotransferase [Clostridia bacterium]
MEIKITKNTAPKAKVPANELRFGTTFTDHMFIMKYSPEKGWHDAEIRPYGPISLDPSAMVFHYAQEIFEGLKAYRTSENGDIYLFRPEKNFERMNQSCDRMCIPRFDGDEMLDALEKLIKIDADWIPTAPGTSLYIRPFIIATDSHVGVHPSGHYLFVIILSPVGSYFKEGLKPVKIYVETEYTRAARGGTGMAKCGGNYAASLIGQQKAEKLNYSQVLWLDGQEHKYVEEVGAMNVFFKIDGTIVTPALDGSILPGITRRSVLEFLRHKGYKVEERALPIDELMAAANSGKLEEAWGTGTAAVISPIGELNRDGNACVINNNSIGPVSQMLYDELTGIQWGLKDDPFGWRHIVK